MKTTELEEASVTTSTGHSERLPEIDENVLNLQCSVVPTKGQRRHSSIPMDQDILARASPVLRPSNAQVSVS
jgi:hypothetical protein